jgi:hypothetical protein
VEASWRGLKAGFAEKSGQEVLVRGLARDGVD